MDLDGSGAIERRELVALFRNLGLDPTEAEIDDMFRQSDLDGDGQLQLREFLDLFAHALSAHTSRQLEIAHMKELLRAMGEDKGEFIKKSKLACPLRDQYDLDIDLDAVLAAAFRNGVGHVTEAHSMMDDKL